MDFLGTLLCSVGVVVFSLLDWIRIPFIGDYNLFSMWGTLDNLNWLFSDSLEYTTLRTLVIMLSIALLLSFTLLVISLARYQSEKRAVLTYLGFGLSSFVSLIFILLVIRSSSNLSNSGLTLFPVLTLISAVIAMILFYLNNKGRVLDSLNKSRWQGTSCEFEFLSDGTVVLTTSKSPVFGSWEAEGSTLTMQNINEFSGIWSYQVLENMLTLSRNGNQMMLKRLPTSIWLS